MAEPTASNRPETRYERSDVPPALVAKIAAGLAATIIGAVLLLWAIFPGAVTWSPRQPRVEPPSPRLQVAERQDLAALRAREEARLHGYAWTGPDRQHVRIPIEQAMRMVAERGIPDWPAAAK
jgi:uncharacterized protein HemX